MMVIGSDALDSDKSIRKLIRRATDRVFDQFACASPHTILLRKAARFLHRSLQKARAGMDKALTRLPTGTRRGSGQQDSRQNR